MFQKSCFGIFCKYTRLSLILTINTLLTVIIFYIITRKNRYVYPEHYSNNVEDVFTELNTGTAGLSTAEANERLNTYGPNALAKSKGLNIFKLILHQFTDPLIYILIIAAVITAFLGDYIDTVIILLVVAINAIIGFIQEFKAEKAVSALRSLSAPKAMVIRDNEVAEIDSEEIVPGDIVLLNSGTKVPADLRLFEATKLEVDESALTGESMSVRKHTDPLPRTDLSLGDIKNSVFMGTLVLSGRAKGIVVSTGKKTQLGQISHEVATIKSVATPLQEKLTHMSNRIGFAIVGVSILAIVLGLLLGEDLYDMILTGIALAVGAIPEGLPIVVTITLAIGINRMAQRHAIIRKLPAVETLGSTTVIASDKTGTMTKNEMTVTKIYADHKYYRVTGTGFSPEGQIIPEDGAGDAVKNNRALEMCLRAGLLANESYLELDEETGRYKSRGDPTEVCLITSAMKGGLHEGQELVTHQRLDEIPFESDRMYMASLYRNREDGDNTAFLKGAPDRILNMCDRMMMADGNIVPIDQEKIRGSLDSMGLEGLRVLAMAYKAISREARSIEPDMVGEGCVFVGLQGMYDPPREEAYEAIKHAKKSGIRVIMVTGDHKSTAISIARKLGIVDPEDTGVITGQELDRMSDRELYDKLETISIFSRVAPLHKLRIVKQLINRGEVVAVTGDGVNDTPALKAAHIGVAMGRAGTDAAKETSEMIITDDNFASIYDAVKEGRVVFSNIRKVTLFLLSGGLGQVLLILATLVFRLPLPLLPAQIIWMNLVTNGLQDVAMAFEPPEKGIEDEKPRERTEPVISRLMIERLIVIGVVLMVGTLAIYYVELNAGSSIERARTVALTTLVLFQLFNVFNCRSETRSVFRMNPLSNPFLFFSIVASVIAQVALVYFEPLQAIFRTTALSLNDWLVIVPVAFTVIIVVEIEKVIRRYLKKRKAPGDKL